MVFKLQKEYYIFSNKKYFIIYLSKQTGYTFNVAFPVLAKPSSPPTAHAGELMAFAVQIQSFLSVKTSLIYVFTVIPLFFLSKY